MAKANAAERLRRALVMNTGSRMADGKPYAGHGKEHCGERNGVHKREADPICPQKPKYHG